MVYILKGWVTFEYEDKEPLLFMRGPFWPPKISREIEHSEDLELLEITSPLLLILRLCNLLLVIS